MKEQTFGGMIAMLRKEKNTIPKLAEIFNLTIDELMQVKKGRKENVKNQKAADITRLALKGVALAMGIAVTVLSVLNEIGVNEAIRMLGIGLACLAVLQFSQKDE